MKGITFLFVLFLSGCATYKAPYTAYQGNIPYPETVVFIASHAKSPLPLQARINKVDGIDIPAYIGYTIGYPIWVRVTPGTHTFNIKYTAEVSLFYGTVIYANFEITIPDMKPKHIYSAHYSYDKETKKAYIAVDELEESTNFPKELGLSSETTYESFFPDIISQGSY